MDVVTDPIELSRIKCENEIQRGPRIILRFYRNSFGNNHFLNSADFCINMTLTLYDTKIIFTFQKCTLR